MVGENASRCQHQMSFDRHSCAPSHLLPDYVWRKLFGNEVVRTSPADMVETVLLQRGIKGTLPVRLVYRSLYCVFTGKG